MQGVARSRRKSKREQWFAFQRVWLANLRRELLGTDDHFGNPFCDRFVKNDKPILPDQTIMDNASPPPRTLILDLDETLVHTEFDQTRGWITHRRPYVSSFLAAVSKNYEVVCFTSGLKSYASPIIDQLDHDQCISHRLYRDHALALKGIHVKDLSRLNRDLQRTIIIDNSPESYLMQPENAIPIKPFFGDLQDTALLDLVPFLEDIVRKDLSDVRTVLKRCHLKGRFARDSSKKWLSGDHVMKDRRISDLGAPPSTALDNIDEDTVRSRSFSDVGGITDSCHVAWEGGMDGNGSWLDPIVIDVAPDHCGNYHTSSSNGIGAHSTPRNYHRAHTDSNMESYCDHNEVAGRRSTDTAVDGDRNEGAGAATGHGGDAGVHAMHHPANQRRLEDGGAKSDSSQLLDWSAVHGAFAEVLRGMSPPPSFATSGFSPCIGEGSAEDEEYASSDASGRDNWVGGEGYGREGGSWDCSAEAERGDTKRRGGA